MTNHPNRSRTYWYNSPRGFANEYTVGIATTAVKAREYEDNGFERITRARALRELSDKGDDATQMFADVTINGSQLNLYRSEVARAIRNGDAI